MRIRLALLAVALVSLLTSGCSFAYYNTFFNAKHYYNEAQEQPLRDDGRPSAAAVQNYTKAIQKCGIIITEYKETKWVDDALFLLAKCLYLKGNSSVQAYEKFQDLLKYYPDSPFIPEAKLYMARCQRDMRRKEEAYRLAQEFLVVSEYDWLHSEALLITAEWRIEDEDFIRAEALLTRLLKEYPESDEFEEAFFLLGRTYQNQGDYERSTEVFQQLIDSGVERRTRLDAQYHIAENLHSLGQFEESLEACKKLTKAEYIEDSLPRIELLTARNLADLGRTEEAITQLKNIIEDNPRTFVSAESSYWLAEIFFTTTLNYESAIEYYNRVKREKGKSPFVESAVTRSAVASQILQFQDTEREISAQDLVNEQFKLAEYYLDVLAMPDSALAVYDRVQAQELRIGRQIAHLDSMLQAELASIDEADTLEHPTVDSLQVALERHTDDAAMYAQEFSPFSQFCKVWVYASVMQDTASAQAILAQMQAEDPDNRYTVGAEDFLAGNQVEFRTLRERRALSAYSDAADLIESDPAEAVVRLTGVLDDYNDLYGEQTLYALGWVNLFQLGDSLAAAAWFDSLIQVAVTSDYTDQVAMFYEDGAFIKLDRLPKLVDDEQALLDEAEEEAEGAEQEQETTRSYGPKPTTLRDAVYDTPPSVLNEYYPPNNTGRVIIGETILFVEILEDGDIGAIEIFRSFDDSPGGLDELAVRAIKKWEFTPAMLEERPVACWLHVPIHYGPLVTEE